MKLVLPIPSRSALQFQEGALGGDEFRFAELLFFPQEQQPLKGIAGVALEAEFPDGLRQHPKHPFAVVVLHRPDPKLDAVCSHMV